jgi:hypothetical protein
MIYKIWLVVLTPLRRKKTCSKPPTRDVTSRITSYSPRRLSRRKRRHFHCLRQCVSLVAQEQELGCRAAMGSFNQSKFTWHHHILRKKTQPKLPQLNILNHDVN